MGKCRVLEKIRLDRLRHAAPQVFDRLRDAIVSLELAPGTVLARHVLAEQFGISQTPIRDALMRLGEEGLVDIFPQHATVVSRIDVPAAREAHFLRRSIELEIVRGLARQVPEGLIARLQAQIVLQTTLAEAQNYRDFVAADQARGRHRRNLDPVHAVERTVDRGVVAVDDGAAEAVLRGHQAIVEAIARQDSEGAQATLRAHLSGTLSALDEICARYPEYVTT